MPQSSSLLAWIRHTGTFNHFLLKLIAQEKSDVKNKNLLLKAKIGFCEDK
jgi:hypothetical protein